MQHPFFHQLATRLLGISTALMIGLPAMASDQTDELILEEIWQSPETSAVFFSEPFLKKIPSGQVSLFLGDMIEQCGELITIHKTSKDHEYRMVTDQCEIPTVIWRNEDGKIDRLSLYQPVLRKASLEDLLDEISAFDGSVSYAVFENSKLIADHNGDQPMAVGSSFKLIVLAALLDLIEEDKAAWSDVLTLEEKHLSLGSGILHKNQIGAPFTLHTLAMAMIAHSDNTATDILIDFVGRDRLEMMSGLAPFLTTREFFLFKSDQAAYERYREADNSSRKAILDELKEASLPSQLMLTHWKPEAEWLLSSRSLCAWIEEVAALELTQINTGVLRSAGWQRVAFKGGSEIGVLNFTTWALDQNDREFCVSATWNADQAIDQDPLKILYAGLFHALKKRP